jgi:ferredoxin
MRVKTDRHACIGAGLCALTAPAVFGQGEDGLVQARLDEVPEAELDAAYEAGELCPGRAIQLTKR